MMQRWIITALGKDQPGIVAGVTEILYGLGCNLEDSAMTRLEGEFAVMLIFSGARSLTIARLRQAFTPLERRLALSVHVKPLSPSETKAKPAARSRPYLISVYGADRPGIVFRVSQELAKAKINITDVETHCSQPPAGRRVRALYMMLLEVEVPPRVSGSDLEQRLQRLGKRLGVEVSLRSAEPDVL